jgi:hypothetical protein
VFRSLASLVSALSGVVANGQQTMQACCPPPRRTVRADFPHTALRQSLGARHSRGVEDVQDLQIQQPISLQSCIQAFALSEGFAPSLAPVSRLALQPSFHRRRETFSGIPGSSRNPSAIHSVIERFRLKRYLPSLIKT